MVDKGVGYLIKNINDKLKVHADADLKGHNLTLAQSRVMAFLSDKGGRASQKEIEDFLEVSHPTVVGIVSRMEKNGHVECYADEKDRRNKIVALTEEARAMGADMEKQIDENEKKMLKGLSDGQIEEFKKTLAVIYDNLNG